VYIRNNIIPKESIKALYYITKSLNLSQPTAELHLHRQMTGRDTPRTPQSLQGTPDNYLVLSSIGFNKASVVHLWLVLSKWSKLYDMQGQIQGIVVAEPT
jgi:hypothetical protein